MSGGRRWVCWALALAALGGCAQRDGEITGRPAPIVGEETPELRAAAQAVQRDPVAYLHRVQQRCAELDAYTLCFTRYERRGLLRILHGPEHIDAWFRQEPFSVRLSWTDPDIKYGESAYVAGRHDDKVRFTTRWWVPPLLPPPRINTVDLKTPVIWGESRQPMTDFGLERLMDRTLASLAAAGEAAEVSYLGIAEMPHGHDRVHHLRLTYPDGWEPVPVQELYVALGRDLPRGTELLHADGKLEAAYFYDDIDVDIELSDEDFLLSVERSAADDGAADESQ